MKGLIVRTTGAFYEIITDAKDRFTGVLRGKIKLGDLKVTNPIAVGDYVEFDIIEKDDEGKVAIHKIYPRNNYLIRNSTHKKNFGQLIAANMDQVILVATIAFPRTSLGFIDRFLITTESFRIPAIIIFNKIDLYSEEMEAYNQELIQLYQSLGYKCYQTSTTENIGITELREALKGKKAVFSGHSGVGKSSLLNALYPNLDLRTGEISDSSSKGTHTTTFAEMFEVDESNTYLIDTPGINEFGLNEISDQELSHYFPEMRALLGQCKYNNCMHVSEPGCVVQDKLETGEIAFSRYDSYLSILANDDNRR
jgi:ribosome biogenesis GTPase / thiamine phosphate phosphatase